MKTELKRVSSPKNYSTSKTEGTSINDIYEKLIARKKAAFKELEINKERWLRRDSCMLG